MTTPNHSPIPWEVVPHPIDKLGMILDKSGSRLIGYAHATENISKEESRANLEFIARAANSHEALVTIARWVVHKECGCGTIGPCMHEIAYDTLDKLKAEGEPE